MSAERLEGQVIIVTGAGRGIGAAVARDLATRGAQLVLDDNGSAADGTGNDPSIIDAITKETHGLGAEAVSSTIDVAARGGCTALVELALDSFGRLDGVVNSAGVQRDRGVLHVTDEDLDAFLGTHIRAGFELTRVAARAMIDRGEGGSIIHMTSPAAFFGSARKAGASAAAAAIVGLTRSAAVELRKHAVRVNAVAPTARTRTTEELPLFKGMRTVR
ncbi:MAG: short-chain dehydrogenase [Deltaproteobacteria bacterium]|nr:MAG: short-chain dehydrogenase [Deltaproteobacteria bacterium]